MHSAIGTQLARIGTHQQRLGIERQQTMARSALRISKIHSMAADTAFKYLHAKGSISQEPQANDPALSSTLRKYFAFMR